MKLRNLKSNEINWDEVFAERGNALPGVMQLPLSSEDAKHAKHRHASRSSRLRVRRTNYLMNQLLRGCSEERTSAVLPLRDRGRQEPFHLSRNAAKSPHFAPST
jgi:hypothetical protein